MTSTHSASPPPLQTLDEVVIVAHAGPLEAKAVVLAASIREKMGKRVRINIGQPEPVSHWGEISAPALQVFKELGAHIVSVENPINLEYPYGNKICAMASVDRPCAFLDSDMIVLRPLAAHWALQCADAALKYADIDTFQRGGGNWRGVYHLFNCEVPRVFVRATDTKEVMAPYYNAGFVWVRNGKAFSEMWADTAQQLDAAKHVVNKRPWLDQIAIPVALNRLGWTLSPVPDALNFPGHIRDIEDDVPYILHYHDPENMTKSDLVMDVMRQCALKYPLILDTIKPHEEWTKVREAL